MASNDFNDELILEFKDSIESSSRHWYDNLQLLGQGGNAVTYLMIGLEPLGQIPGDSGRIIRDHIHSMLRKDPAKRPTAEELLEMWRGTFFRVAANQRAIDGRVL